MTDWTITRYGAARAGWVGGVVVSIRSIGRRRKGRAQAVPENLRDDVGLVRGERPRGWWEYR